MLENKKLVFIVGSARSGTSWLRRILSESPQVASAPETHLFDNYLSSVLPGWDRYVGRKTGISALMTEGEYLRWINDLVDRCLRRIIDQKPHATIVVEKTPGHGRHAAEILRLYPDAHFIHVIRDPRAVVTSTIASSKSWAAGWAPRRLKDACAYWKHRVGVGQAIAGITSRYREVFYERLHADGADQVSQLLAWLQEPVSDHEAASYVAACAFEKMRSPVASTEEADKLFFRRGEVDSWRRELSGSDIAIIERLTRKQMAALGYKTVAGRRDRMVAEARLQSYRLANTLAKAVRAGADRLKP